MFGTNGHVHGHLPRDFFGVGNGILLQTYGNPSTRLLVAGIARWINVTTIP